MKKTLMLTLVCLLLFALPAFAEIETLSKTETDVYAQAVLKNALTDNAYQSEQKDGAYLLHFKNYTLRTDSDRLTANTTVYAVLMNDLSDVDECPGDLRALKLNDSLNVLLSVYPLENATLLGTRENAVLYVEGELPGQAAVGYLFRDGQRVTEIDHILYFMGSDGVTTRRARYTLSDGAIVGIEIDLAGDSMSLEDAAAELDAFKMLRQTGEYAAYMQTGEAADAAPFGRDDLLFSGLDYLGLTPEDAVNLLGDDYAEEWLSDGDTAIHVMEWATATITFLCDKDKNVIQTDNYYTDEDALEGPRGIRVGDQQQNVLDRFYFGAGEALGDVTYLYGGQDEDEYAAVEYVSAGEMTARYAFAQEDRQIVMILSFENARLKSILIQTY